MKKQTLEQEVEFFERQSVAVHGCQPGLTYLISLVDQKYISFNVLPGTMNLARI